MEFAQFAYLLENPQNWYSLEMFSREYSPITRKSLEMDGQILYALFLIRS